MINNAQEPITPISGKVRILQQEENIFVNPAWNLGAGQASSRYLIISNDDIAIGPVVVDALLQHLRRGRVGVIGVGRSCFKAGPNGVPRFRAAYWRSFGFGTLMAMPRENYIEIPSDLKIWSGDDWLFDRQSQRNYTLEGVRVGTRMSVTSGEPRFHEQSVLDRRLYQSKYRSDAYTRRHRLGDLVARVVNKVSPYHPE